MALTLPLTVPLPRSAHSLSLLSLPSLLSLLWSAEVYAMWGKNAPPQDSQSFAGCGAGLHRIIEPRRGDSILAGDKIPGHIGDRQVVPCARRAPPHQRSILATAHALTATRSRGSRRPLHPCGGRATLVGYLRRPF